jgi:putative membrane protein
MNGAPLLYAWDIPSLVGFALFLFWWFVLVFVAYVVYRDAKKRGMDGLLWFALIILPVIGLVFLILYAVIREACPLWGRKGGEAAHDILNERYARGELTREEYETMKEDLKR